MSTGQTPGTVSADRRVRALAWSRSSPVRFHPGHLPDPLVSIVPFKAATPALVVVGFLLITQIRNIDLTD